MPAAGLAGIVSTREHAPKNPANAIRSEWSARSGTRRTRTVATYSRGHVKQILLLQALLNNAHLAEGILSSQSERWLDLVAEPSLQVLLAPAKPAFFIV
jgi:hypothetical protein